LGAQFGEQPTTQEAMRRCTEAFIAGVLGGVQQLHQPIKLRSDDSAACAIIALR
jgi:hypothetical protein